MTKATRRMLVLCPYPMGVAAGQRLKFEQYYDDWRTAGWEVVVSPFMDRGLWDVAFDRGHYPAKAMGIVKGVARRLRDLARIRDFDLIYCFMYVTPLGSSLFERIARKLARRMVFDVEDNVVAGVAEIDNHPNPLLRFLRGAGKFRYLARKADHVITSAPALNGLCLAINEKRACTYISSSIDADRFVPANRYNNERELVIGWTGTFSTRRYLDLLRPVFQRLAKTRRFRVRIIGNFDYDLPGVKLEVIRWTRQNEVEDLHAIDIGVYPLMMEDWAGGKSGLKAIQYMMLGLPCVATNTGTTPLIIEDGVNGLLVRSEDEWVEALASLIDNPELRRGLGEEARRVAVERFSTRAVARDYRRVLEGVMEGSVVAAA